MAAKKTNEKDTLLAVALTRAAAALKDKTVELEPGVHEIDVTLRIYGDITVGESTTRVSLGVSDGDLAAAMIDRMPEADRANAVRYAMARIFNSESADMKCAKAVKKELVERYADREGLITDVQVSGRVTGAPRIEIITSKKGAKAA